MTPTNESAVPDLIDVIVAVNAAAAGGTRAAPAAVEVVFAVRNAGERKRTSVEVAAPASGSGAAVNATHVVDHHIDIDPVDQWDI